MTILDTFFILFDSDASKLDKGIDQSEKKAEGLIDKLKGVDKEGAKAGASLYDLVGKGAGLLGVALSIGALAKGVSETAAAYDQLGKLATRFRSTADAVDEFRDAAGLLGISEETSVGALTALDTAIQDTFLGMGRAKKVFEEMGLAVTDAEGKIKPTTEVMGELADKMKDMEKGTQIRIMERLGLDSAMLKLFNADMVAMQKRMAEVDKASGFNLDQAVKRANEFTKASKGLSFEVNVLQMYMEKLAEKFKIATMPFFTDALTVATKYVKMFVDFLLKHNKFMEGIFIAVGAAISYFLVPAAIQGAIAVWAMIAPFVAVGLAVAAVGVAFALLYDDIVNFMEGGDSMIGEIVNRWPIIGEVAAQIGEALKSLWDLGIQIFDFFVDMWNDPAAAFRAFLDVILNGLINLLNAIPGVSSALSMLGIGGGKTGEGVAAGKDALGVASSTGLASQTSNSISTTNRGGKNTQVTVGKVEVKTAATDAEGISKAIGGSMQAQMRQAASNYDDGVLA